MEGHARVLQQRVQRGTVSGHVDQAFKGVAGEQYKQQESDADAAQYAEHSREQHRGYARAKQGNSRGPDRVNETPEQD